MKLVFPLIALSLLILLPVIQAQYIPTPVLWVPLQNDNLDHSSTNSFYLDQLDSTNFTITNANSIFGLNSGVQNVSQNGLIFGLKNSFAGEPYTYSFWYFGQANGWMSSLHYAGGPSDYSLNQIGSEIWSYQTGQPGLSTTIQPINNTWNFITVSCGGSGGIYINGTYASSSFYCSDTMPNPTNVSLMGNVGAMGQGAFGQMFYFAYFNESLNSSQIEQLYLQEGNPYSSANSTTFAQYSYSKTGYETVPQNTIAAYNFTQANLTNLNATFWYDGQPYPVSTDIVYPLPEPYCGAFCNLEYIFNATWVPGLEAMNGTVETWFYQFTQTFSNGQTLTFNDTPQNQTIYWAYFLGSPALTTDEQAYVATQSSTADFFLTLLAGNINVESNLTLSYFNKTVIGRSQNPSFSLVAPNTYAATSTFNVGNTPLANDNRTWLGQVNFTFRNPVGILTFRFLNASDLVNVTTVVLTNCSNVTYPYNQQAAVLNLTLLDEQSSAAVYNGTIQVVNNFYPTSPQFAQNSSFNISLGPLTNNASICIYPAYASVIDSAFLAYVAPNYSPRTYAFTAPLSNFTQDLNLYLLNANYSDLVQFEVVDQNNIPVSGVQVQIQEWFPATNSYLTVAGFTSDALGRGQTYLNVPSIQYRYLMSVNGVLINTVGPQNIYCPSGETCPPEPYSVILQLNPQLPPNPYQFGSDSASCIFNNATANLLCTVINSNGVSQPFSLTVLERQALDFQTICTRNATSSSVTLVCNLGSFAGNYYQYSVYVVTAQGNQLIGGGVLDFTSSASAYWGSDNLFFTLLIMACLFFLFLQLGPEMAIVMGGGVGALLSFLIGVLPLDLATVVGFICIVGFTVFAMGR